MSRYLIVPGYQNSDPEHWQSLWQAEWGSAAQRFAPTSWDEPVFEDWFAALDRAVTPGAILVAHSLGTLISLAWLARNPGVVAAAFLVAVPDPDGPNFPPSISGFERPAHPVQTPVVVVGSTDDPFASWEFTERTAALLSVQPVSMGAAGHLGAYAGLGTWPRGRALLAGLEAALGTASA